MRSAATNVGHRRDDDHLRPAPLVELRERQVRDEVQAAGQRHRLVPLRGRVEGERAGVGEYLVRGEHVRAEHVQRDDRGRLDRIVHRWRTRSHSR